MVLIAQQNLNQIREHNRIQAKFWDVSKFKPNSWTPPHNLSQNLDPKFEHVLSVNRGHSSAEGQNLNFHSQTVGKYF